MKIKIDENIPAGCLEKALALGYNVSSIQSQNMTGWSDTDLWPIVQKERRLFITQDRGFGDIRRYPPGSHSRRRHCSYRIRFQYICSI